VGCAAKEKPAAALAPPPPPVAAAPVPAPTPHLTGTVGENLVSATAKVKKLNLKKRMVTLERADGSPVTIHVDEHVRNLKHVKVGDEVTVQYYESLAFEVRDLRGALVLRRAAGGIDGLLNEPLILGDVVQVRGELVDQDHAERGSPPSATPPARLREDVDTGAGNQRQEHNAGSKPAAQ
jgi:hypothetical protein